MRHALIALTLCLTACQPMPHSVPAGASEALCETDSECEALDNTAIHETLSRIERRLDKLDSTVKTIDSIAQQQKQDRIDLQAVEQCHKTCNDKFGYLDTDSPTYEKRMECAKECNKLPSPPFSC